MTGREAPGSAPRTVYQVLLFSSFPNQPTRDGLLFSTFSTHTHFLFNLQSREPRRV